MSPSSTVLVVDDERDTADTFTSGLSEEYDVVTAYSGEDALDRLDESIDVVLLDRRMPGMSGDEVLAEIRNREINCRVVMVTAVDPDLDIIEMEFDEYLVKPVSVQTLLDTVERMQRRTAVEEQIQETFSVASRLATLESKLNYSQLESSEEYKQLRAEFERRREEMKTSVSDDDPYLETAIEKMEALLEEAGSSRQI
jgi:DNA-binding response OmpR family regulator